MSFRLASRNALSFMAGVTVALSAMLIYRWATSDPQGDSRRRRVIVFGDSITQHGFNTEISGWVAMLAHWWSRRVDVINRGYSGYNTKWARQIVDKVVSPQRPDLVFVFFGANDAVHSSVLQHVPLQAYGDNIRAIVQYIRTTLPKTSIILITPPPVWEDKLQFFNSAKGKPLLIDRTNERTLEYVQACQSIGKEFKIPVVNAWSAMEGNSENRARYLSDGLHLSAEGCQALFKAVQATILRHHPDWNPELMTMDFPEWSKFESTPL